MKKVALLFVVIHLIAYGIAVSAEVAPSEKAAPVETLEERIKDRIGVLKEELIRVRDIRVQSAERELKIIGAISQLDDVLKESKASE